MKQRTVGDIVRDLVELEEENQQSYRETHCGVGHYPEQRDELLAELVKAYRRKAQAELQADLAAQRWPTAHGLAADWGWMDDHEAFRIGRGTVEWEQAEYPTEPRTRQYMHRVKVSRLVPVGSKVRVQTQYVRPETPVVLVPRRAPSE